MVLGYKNFLRFNDEQRAAYRDSLRNKSIQELHRLEHEKTVGRISAGYTFLNGVVASFFTSGFSLTVSGAAWRKGHVAHRKLKFVLGELLRQHEPLYKAGVKDWTLAAITCAIGNAVGAGIIDGGVAQSGSGSSAAAGAIAGGDIASSTAAFVAAQAIGEVHSELLLKGYSHTFEADKGSKSTCARAKSPSKIACNACSRAIANGPFMRE